MAEKQEYILLDDVIRTLGSIVEIINPFLSGHQQRVSALASAIAAELKLPPEVIQATRVAGLVHDIGEIGIPIQILSKPGRLTAQEFDLIKAHPQTGYGILKQIPFSQPLAEFVLQHHERLDGTGYPHGVKGEKIHKPAQILGVAEVVEAISSQRPYRTAPGLDSALDEISKHKGKQFAPDVVDACVRVFREKHFRFQ
jgi:HD-GYP domain-containing protein (c-di-GMP phosphodiesterase class II)